MERLCFLCSIYHFMLLYNFIPTETPLVIGTDVVVVVAVTTMIVSEGEFVVV